MTNAPTGGGSMRFSLEELLAGMLASIDEGEFPDDIPGLQKAFDALAKDYPLLAPFGAEGAAGAMEAAFGRLQERKILERAEGRFTLTDQGRAHCVSSKRTLFNEGDRVQLEAAATAFGAR